MSARCQTARALLVLLFRVLPPSRKSWCSLARAPFKANWH